MRTPERIEYERRYRAENRESIRAGQRRWAEENPDRAKATQARYRAAHPGRTAEATKRSRAKHQVGYMLATARASAKRRGLEFAITAADIAVPARCPVLGIPLLAGQGRRGATDCSPTIDRIDNCRGYVPGNVIVVSWRANRLKADATSGELRRIADFYWPLEMLQ